MVRVIGQAPVPAQRGTRRPDWERASINSELGWFLAPAFRRTCLRTTRGLSSIPRLAGSSSSRFQHSYGFTSSPSLERSISITCTRGSPAEQALTHTHADTVTTGSLA
ncbi:hypothetical protein C8Q74DRAFT_1226567 [Fomes fomentarius]|nr:hypothetical protein C8Q74DRAFT_1226567 [Fomes fomentarius]